MGRPALVVALVIMGAAGNTTLSASNEALWSAARAGNIEAVQTALAEGTPLDARTKQGATALFYAARYGHAELVAYLADRGADLDVVAAVEVAERAWRVSALGAAGLGGYADVVRILFEHGAEPPELLVLHHSLLPFDSDALERQRDYEVVETALRLPEVEAIAHAIVERDAAGTYRSHDGQQYEVRARDGAFDLVARDESVIGLQSVGGRAFAQSAPRSTGRPSRGQREWSEADVTMLGRFLNRAGPEERKRLLQQYVEHGGVWLDFTIGNGQALGFSLRHGAPGRLGGPLMLFRKTGVRPDVWPSLDRTLSTGSVAAPMNWPSFRGHRAAGVADGQFPPATWDAETSVNIQWKTPIPGLGNSSPILWGDKIFVTTSVRSDTDAEFRQGQGGLTGGHTADDRVEHAWKIYCLDKATGDILWERTARRDVPRAGRHVKSTFANPTPVTNGKFVIALFGPEGLHAYDMEGRPMWTQDFGIVGMPSWGFASSPILYRDLVIIQADTSEAGEGEVASRTETSFSPSFVAAFDVSEGTERWRTLRDEGGTSFGTPTIFEGPDRVQLITNGGKRVRSYDPMSGKELWSFTAGTRNVTPTPVAGHELIFVTSGFSGVQPIYAIRPSASGDISLEDGEDTNAFVAWSKSRGGTYTPTPIVYGDYLYAVNVSGILSCYDASTGERMYRARLPHMGGGFSSSPVAADGRLYFSSEDGDVFVIKAGPEFEHLATNSMGEVIMATPAISGGKIFIRTLHHLFSIG